MTVKKGSISRQREWYRKLIATIPELDVKGDSMQYTSLNGNMFTFISKDDIVGIRLPKEQREAFIERYDTCLYEAHGSILKEYVTVPDDLLAKTKIMKNHLETSYEYAKTLKPKPTKKAKK